MVDAAFQHVDLAAAAEAVTAGVRQIDAGPQAGVEHGLPLRDFDGLSQWLYGQSVAHCFSPVAPVLSASL